MEYIRLEVLTDCICRKCSMRATLHRLEQDAERLAAVTSKSTVSQSKKKRVREVKRFATRLKAALDEGRVEEDIKGVKMEKVFSRASTKQAMVARASRSSLFLSCSAFNIRTHTAATRTCITSEPFRPFWRIRLQKHRTCAFSQKCSTLHHTRPRACSPPRPRSPSLHIYPQPPPSPPPWPSRSPKPKHTRHRGCSTVSRQWCATTGSIHSDTTSASDASPAAQGASCRRGWTRDRHQAEAGCA